MKLFKKISEKITLRVKYLTSKKVHVIEIKYLSDEI
jgi:hypothetical protein